MPAIMLGMTWLPRMHQNHNGLGRFFYITGTDGTGKSTQAELLTNHLANCGIRCRRLWLRYPFLFSIPFLAYARWNGYSWHEVNSMVDHGYWDFSHSWILRNIFPWALFVDALLAAIEKIYIPLSLGESIVCERFVLDMLVDLSIATKNHQFIDRLAGKLFAHLLPQNSKIVILDLDHKTICSRRANLAFDHALASRLEVYKLLANKLKLPIIDTHLPIPDVNHEIMTIMELS